MTSIELTDTEHVPVRYLPKILTKKDRKQQTKNLIKSRKMLMKFMELLMFLKKRH